MSDPLQLILESIQHIERMLVDIEDRLSAQGLGHGGLIGPRCRSCGYLLSQDGGGHYYYCPEKHNAP